MRKKLLIRCAIGFLLGMVLVMLIPALINRGSDGAVMLYSPDLLARVGSPTAAILMSLLLFGLYGAICMGGTLLYEIESWPLALATAVHYLLVALNYAIVARLLCWNLPLKDLLLFEGIMTVGFVLIWLIMYLRYRAEIRELNDLITRNKKEETKK